MNDNERMAELLLPNITREPEYYEALYPERELKEGAKVVRIAPSPTGYLHLGTLFMALVNRLAADSSDGVFFTRIEDTDKKREVEGGIADIIEGLIHFGIKIDEGFISADEQSGKYAPYKQSERAEIYQCYAKKLIREGFAYPCFCTAEELEETRKIQEERKIRTGYHGEWAKHRNITFDEAKALIDAGLPYVIRLRAPGNEANKIVFDDAIKGRIEMPENDEDLVILKSDGIPTYHFAHVIDDHLMHTTHVMRGDEWISSVPKHIQMFRLLGFKVPKFAHVSPIMKLDNGAKRKISKRKDPEAAVHFFVEEGYPADSVIEYLMTVAASDFEDWRRANPSAPREQFKFNLKRMSVSGALFDENKLTDVSKNYISTLSGDEVYAAVTEWAKEFDPEFYEILVSDVVYSKKVFSIGRDAGAKPRKDLAKWNETKDYFSYFFPALYVPDYTFPENLNKADIDAFLTKYAAVYDDTLDNTAWFDSLKGLCPEFGFAAETKEYKANPELYKGSVGDLSTVLRIAVTGRRNTPDLCTIMKILGKNECIRRINDAVKRG